jgi:hypothetical protein
LCISTENRPGLLPTALALGLIGACLAGEAAVLHTGIDDLDEGYFVQQALRVLHGQVPYRDFQTLYTPGLVTLHALMFWALGGPYVLAPRVVALVARAALAIVLYTLTRPLVRQPVWAAAPSLFLLVGLDDAPERWEPHPGWLSTLFAVLATWCVARGPIGRPPAMRWLVGSGLAAGVAYLFKQNTGAFMLAAILVWGAFGSPEWRKRVLVPLAAFAAITLVWLVPLLIVLQGHFALLGEFVGAINQAGLGSPAEPSIGIPLLCLAGGLWLARRFGSGPDARLRWYLLAGSALFCTQYPRMDTLHLAWSAPLLLVVGAVALDRVRPVAAALGVVLGAFLLTGPLLAARVELIRQPLVAIENVRFASDLEVPAPTAADLQGVVADIQLRTQPGEPIFVYPTSPLLYALAERPNPTRFDHLNPGAATPSQIAGIIADLEAAHLRVVVISDFWQTAWGPPGPNAPLEAWLDSRFTEVARYGAYRVLVPGL